MTTAARPTFDPAKGGSSVNDRSIGKLSQLVSSRDLPAHTKLKERAPGQDTVEELKAIDLKAELEEREKIAQIEKTKEPPYRYVPSLEQATQVKLALKAERDKERIAHREALLDAEDTTLEQKLPIIINARKMAQLDKDEDFGSDNDFSESDFNDDDDEDDPAELMAELQRIRQERQAEEERREMEKKNRFKTPSTVDDDNDDASSTFSIKRRWDDDVPFKNCARDEPDSKRKMYINDTLRSEFHKRFMDKYIR